MKRIAIGLIAALVGMGMLYYGRPLIMPFVLAVSAWYLINILTDTYAKTIPGVNVALPRPLAFLGALATIGGAIYLASWIIVSNINTISRVASYYQENFVEQANRFLYALIPWGEPFSVNSIMSEINLGSLFSSAVSEVTNFFSVSMVVAVYLLFLFLEQKSFKVKLQKLIANSSSGADVLLIMKKVSYDIRMYLGIKTAASLSTAILSYVIFRIVGLEFASFWAFMIFLFNYIPTVGSIVGTILPSFFALMQYVMSMPENENWGAFLAVLIGVTSLQMLIGNILEPRIQGDRLNLSPLVILLSLALWNLIWGIPGMFLCVPFTTIAMIIFSYIPQTHKIAIALSRNGELSKTREENIPDAIIEAAVAEVAELEAIAISAIEDELERDTGNENVSNREEYDRDDDDDDGNAKDVKDLKDLNDEKNVDDKNEKDKNVNDNEDKKINDKSRGDA